MKISIVTLKHYRRPRPGSKKGQPRAGIPSWEGFGKACKEAWEALLGLNHVTPSCPPPPPKESSTTDAYSRGFADGKAKGFQKAMDMPTLTLFNGCQLHDMLEEIDRAEENRRRAFQNLPPVVPQEKKDKEAAWLARVEELKAQVASLQEHNTKEVKDAKHLLAEEMQANKNLTEQVAKANALNDSLSSQAVNLADKAAKLRWALESVEWLKIIVPAGFYSLHEMRCPVCKCFKGVGHEESCPIGKALTNL